MIINSKLSKMSVIMIILMIISNSLLAQKGSSRSHYNEKREKIKVQKIAFITDRLNLTSEEAEKFWPVYYTHEDSVKQIQHSFFEMFEEKTQDIEGLSEEESKELISAKMTQEQSILDQKMKFYKDLEKILPANKVLLLIKAEKDFKVSLMRNLSGPRGDRPGQRGTGRR